MRSILCIPTPTNLPPISPCTSHDVATLLRDATFREKSAAETDPRFRQIIPYCVVTHDGRILTYKRSGSEGRLSGLMSCGIGGHIEEDDHCESLHGHKPGLYAILCAAYREHWEEIGVGPWAMSDPLALICCQEAEVDRVHLGVLFQSTLEEFEMERLRFSSEISDPAFFDLWTIRNSSMLLESWSELAIKFLSDSQA